MKGRFLMGVLMNIYCVPRYPGIVGWATILTALERDALVRPPYRAGSPFRNDSARANFIRPENWIVPETLQPSVSRLPLRDFGGLVEALAYVAKAGDAMITMDAPQASLHVHPDERNFSAALALYRFRDGTHLRVGVPNDFSDLAQEFPELAHQSTQPKWEGTVTELLWLHGKCVPPEEDFIGSPVHEMMRSLWPEHRLLTDEFL